MKKGGTITNRIPFPRPFKLTAANKCHYCGSDPEIYYTFLGYWHIECPKRHIRVSTPLGIVEAVEKWNELNEGEEKNDN